MVKLVEALSNTTSYNEKISMLESYSKDATVLDALKYCYSPFIQTYTNKIDATEKVGTLTFYKAFKKFKPIIDRLSKRELTGNAAKDSVREFLEQCTRETQALYVMILRKDLKCGVSIRSINNAIPNLIPTFNIQLSNTFEKFQNKKAFSNVPYWYASPKLDGIRCYFQTNSSLLTRQGKGLIGFEHIEEELSKLTKKYKLDFIDGELFTTKLPFQVLQGYVMRSKNIKSEHKEQISYHIFVLGKKWDSTDDMIRYFKSIDMSEFKYLKLLPYKKINNTIEAVDALTDKYVSNGYEGIMLRHPINWYSRKRDDNLLKYKHFTENDFTIIDVIEGKNTLADSMGSVLVEGKHDGKKIRSEVGSGFKTLDTVPDNRQWFWDNRELIIGKTIEVRFQNITTEQDDKGFYSLRFPTYSKLKEDR